MTKRRGKRRMDETMDKITEKIKIMFTAMTKKIDQGEMNSIDPVNGWGAIVNRLRRRKGPDRRPIRGLFRILFGVTLLWGVTAAAPLRSDSVTLMVKEEGKPTEEETESGKITKITRSEIVLKDRAGLDMSFPANRVIATQFDDEPVDLQVARTAIDSSQYEDALAKLNGIKSEEIDSADVFIRQDYEFCRAYAAGQLALSGSPDMTLRKAGSRLNEFVKKNADSYHYYEANRMLGNILIALSDFKNAKSFFEVLAGAPWEEMKIEGNIALGGILLDEGDLDGAQRGFEDVLAAKEDSQGVREQKNFAQVGLGRVASMRGDYDRANGIFQSIVDSSDPDDYLLQAKLYNAIGDAAMKAGKDKEATLAYLHVDLLYSSANAEHIKALKNLALLWKKQLRDDRAAEAQSVLRERYKISE